jgi:hypothetical protein
LVEKAGVVLEPFSEIDPGKILEQGQRDGVIERHALILPADRPKAVHPTRCGEL